MYLTAALSWISGGACDGAEAESDNMCASRPFTISPQTIPLSGTSSMTSQSLGGGSMPIGADEEQSLTSHNSDKARLVVWKARVSQRPNKPEDDEAPFSWKSRVSQRAKQPGDMPLTEG